MNNMDVIKKEKKKSKFWKYFRRIILSIFIFIFLLIASAVIILYFYQDSIKKLIVDQINKQLTTEIQVKNVDISLFRKFPNVSLIFTDVTAKDAIISPNKGTLLKAENIYLQFNIWDLYYKNYRIRKIEVKNASANIVVFQDGTDNYHFWKKDTSANNKSFSFDLQKVILDNVNIRYKNFLSDQDYSGIAKNAVIKGQFKSDKYTMYIDGDVFVNYLNVSGVKYFNSKSTTVDLVLNVDQTTDNYTFSGGRVNVGNLKFGISGNVIYSNQKHILNLTVKGTELKLQSFIEEIPAVYKKYLNDYKGKGEFYFTALINGSFAGNDIPVVKINFGINDGQITHKRSGIALENVNFSAEFTNGYQRTLSSSALRIWNFKSKLKSGEFKGNLSINNFVHPNIDLKLDMKMDMNELHEFLKLDTISSVTGNMEMSVTFKGKIDSPENITAKDFIESKTSGTLKIINSDLTLKNDPRKYTNINGEFVFNNNDLEINKLTGNVFSSDFSVKGDFKNLLSYIFLADQKLLVEADLTSANANFDELLKSETSTSANKSYNLSFSDKLDLKLNVAIGKLKFNKFSATNVSGKLRLKSKQLLINSLSITSMDGTTEGLVMVDGSQKDKLLISCDAKLKGVNISKMFYEFGNFGQNSMKDENLKGKLTADIQFASVWSNDLKPDLDKIYSKADIKIEEGELLNYAPMKGLSKFLKLADLNDVKFATLHNQVEIKNKTIYIPAMEIKSSAINIVASGEHTFDNVINYRIKLLLSDVMAQKAKKAKHENEEFGVVEDDGLGRTSLYILVTGTVDNPVYKYDAKGVKAKIAVGFIKEKQNLNSILNDEFGWFKKDTSVINNKEKNNKTEVKLPKKNSKKNKEKENLKKQEDGKFIIDWDEDSLKQK
jgi:hypothetical protein